MKKTTLFKRSRPVLFNETAKHLKMKIQRQEKAKPANNADAYWRVLTHYCA